jgi:hypothetical protein
MRRSLFVMIAFMVISLFACSKKDIKENIVNVTDTSYTKWIRYKWEQPFASTSIWNMPIGSNSEYVAANLPASYYFGVDEEWHIRLTRSEPLCNIYSPSSWNERWPGDLYLGQMPVPDTLVIPDASGSSTPNACAVFLQPDGHTIKQLEPACRKEAGSNRIVGWAASDVDIYGNGITGSHFGSGLSAIGGSIRPGELLGSIPIRHALKLNVWGKYLFYSNQKPGFRWPAERSDAYASTNYHGSNTALVMGSLLAIKPDVNVSSLQLKTSVAKKIFTALQNYGAYISDDSGWDNYDWCMSREVITELQANGIIVYGTSGDYFDDMQKIIAQLYIIDNNTATSIGGGGTPRKPLAPPIAD